MEHSRKFDSDTERMMERRERILRALETDNFNSEELVDALLTKIEELKDNERNLGVKVGRIGGRREFLRHVLLSHGPSPLVDSVEDKERGILIVGSSSGYGKSNWSTAMALRKFMEANPEARIITTHEMVENIKFNAPPPLPDMDRLFEPKFEIDREINRHPNPATRKYNGKGFNTRKNK